MPTSSDSAAEGSSAALSVEGLGAGYGGELVVREIFMSVRPGQIVSVVGPNGSGKSTLLKAITNVIAVSEGKVFLRGKDVTNIGTDALTKRGVGYVPQLNDVFPPLTVQENLEAGAYLLPKKEVRAAMDRVFDIFPQLATMRRRAAGRLSGGERKMLAVGRALMVAPPVLILDEPTANLSPALARVVLGEYVRKLGEEGVAVLLVEQRAREALAVSQWGHVLVAGRTAVSGKASELAARGDIGQLFLGRVRQSATDFAASDGDSQSEIAVKDTAP
jgi:ABC-type branched-subunit amino acid transport system ATPase component